MVSGVQFKGWTSNYVVTFIWEDPRMCGQERTRNWVQPLVLGIPCWRLGCSHFGPLLTVICNAVSEAATCSKNVRPSSVRPCATPESRDTTSFPFSWFLHHTPRRVSSKRAKAAVSLPWTTHTLSSFCFIFTESFLDAFPSWVIGIIIFSEKSVYSLTIDPLSKISFVTEDTEIARRDYKSGMVKIEFVEDMNLRFSRERIM